MKLLLLINKFFAWLTMSLYASQLDDFCGEWDDPKFTKFMEDMIKDL